MTPLLVALGGGVGAPRAASSSRTPRRAASRGGRSLVNVGRVVRCSACSPRCRLDGHALALLGTGFCGGFTTYSAFAVQTHERGPARGTAYAAATLALGARRLRARVTGRSAAQA